MKLPALAPLTDIHVHSDTSHTPKSILRVSNEFGVSAFQGQTVEQVRAAIQAPPGADWDTWYKHMVRTRQAYVLPEAIGELIKDVLLDAAANGVAVIELRISLLSTVKALLDNLGIKDDKEYFRYAKLVFDEIIQVAEECEPYIETDLVVSISCQQKFQKYLDDLMRFCRDYRAHIMALDLTNEKDLPPSHFRGAIEGVRGDIRFLTIHSMEVHGPERGWDALTLEPDRIGHGTRAIEDPALVQELVRRQIPLEICAQSNLVVGTVKRIEDHPMRRLYDAGAVITIGSDGCNDSSTLADNYKLIESGLGFSPEQMAKLRQNSWDNAFRNMKKA